MSSNGFLLSTTKPWAPGRTYPRSSAPRTLAATDVAASHRGEEATEAWDEYAEAVQDELIDEGWSTLDILKAGAECWKRCNEWASTLSEAKARADFSPPPEDTPNG